MGDKMFGTYAKARKSAARAGSDNCAFVLVGLGATGYALTALIADTVTRLVG